MGGDKRSVVFSNVLKVICPVYLSSSSDGPTDEMYWAQQEMESGILF